VTADIRAAYKSFSPAQKEYASALTFWIAEFGATSPFSKLQREQEQQEKEKQQEKKLAEQTEAPKYRLGMGHAGAIIGASKNQQLVAYKNNLNRHNFAIFEKRGKLYEQEAEAVHGYFKKMFELMPDGDLRLQDMNSALKAVLDAGLCFNAAPIWPTIATEEDRRNPPERPRYITTPSGKTLDTATYTG
jgi:hypothetical protein